MNETTTEIITSSVETETTTTQAPIPLLENTPDNVIEGVENASSFLTTLTDKFISALPVLLFAITVFFIGIILSKIVLKITLRFMEKSHVDKTASSFLLSLIRILLYTLVAIIALSMLNVPMTSIVTVIGTAGLAIGLALQNSLSNLAGGFIILFSKPFKCGDTIELEGSVGKVNSISILYTKITTSDNKTVFIPNGQITDAKIINYSESATRRVDMVFDIGYSNDFEFAKRILERIISENKLILKDPPPLVRMGYHKESSIGICVQVWTNNADYWNVYYDLMETVKAEFDKNNIEIPYNQLDVHIRDN